jgi:hypothetical protein
MNTGGPAFPKPKLMQQAVSFDHEEGMTLRDYFAAKAMQSYMMQEVWNPDTYQMAARSAYRVADAMLKAREQ